MVVEVAEMELVWDQAAQAVAAPEAPHKQYQHQPHQAQ